MPPVEFFLGSELVHDPVYAIMVLTRPEDRDPEIARGETKLVHVVFYFLFKPRFAAFLHVMDAYDRDGIISRFSQGGSPLSR